MSPQGAQTNVSVLGSCGRILKSDVSSDELENKPEMPYRSIRAESSLRAELLTGDV